MQHQTRGGTAINGYCPHLLLRSAFYGFPDVTVPGYAAQASGFVTRIPEFETNPQVEEGKFVCVAMTRIRNVEEYRAAKGARGQTDAFVQAALSSGVTADELLRLDGSGSLGMAVKSSQGYTMKAHAPRHIAGTGWAMGRVNNYMIFDVGATILDP